MENLEPNKSLDERQKDIVKKTVKLLLWDAGSWHKRDEIYTHRKGFSLWTKGKPISDLRVYRPKSFKPKLKTRIYLWTVLQINKILRIFCRRK